MAEPSHGPRCCYQCLQTLPHGAPGWPRLRPSHASKNAQNPAQKPTPAACSTAGCEVRQFSGPPPCQILCLQDFFPRSLSPSLPKQACSSGTDSIWEPPYRFSYHDVPLSLATQSISIIDVVLAVHFGHRAPLRRF